MPRRLRRKKSFRDENGKNDSNDEDADDDDDHRVRANLGGFNGAGFFAPAPQCRASLYG